MTLGSHQRVLGKSQVHMTPKRIIAALGPCDCDPTAADARPWNCATRNITEAENGLIPTVAGLRIFETHSLDDRFTIARWVRAGRAADGNSSLYSFTPAMGLKAATQASQEWHEAVATNANTDRHSTRGSREGQAMHHCVATYADSVREGACYVFSVCQSGKRVGTVSLFRDGAQVLIEQVRGPCNTTPTTATMKALQQRLRTRPAAAIQPRDQQSEGLERMSRAIRAAEDDLEDIPF